MNATDIKEIVNSVFEGLISLSVIIGGGAMVDTHPDSTTLVAIASGAIMLVLTAWFGQRGQVKAVNGNITALTNIASGLMVSGKSMSATTPNGGQSA